MKIRNILDRYEDYDIEYDVKDKILFICKPIPVVEFIKIRKCLEMCKEKVEIRVVDRRASLIRKYYGGRL